MPLPDPLALRRLVLAAAVLDDVDVEPRDDGALLPGWRALAVSWAELAAVVGSSDPDGPAARRRVRRHLRASRVVADYPVADYPVADLAERARPLGLPADSPDLPAAGWVQERVRGGALVLGLGFAGVGGDADRVELLTPEALAGAGLPVDWWCPQARSYLARMGELAAERLRRDPAGVLRPMGDCDAVTLLGAAAVRAALAGRDGTGMAGVAMPARRRGWTDLRHLDPAFAPAAAAALDEDERAFPRPLLVTADEVVLVAAGGRPAEIVLRDPSPAATPRPPR
ncbi:MAG: hypothetical protein M3P96_07270 [Actinomycetota bacterium]|nr:hypothetical protein [Actinomycetota bacterium]